MNHKYISAIAAFLILGVLLSATPLAYGVNVLTFGPKLDVVTIPQDNQILKKGIIILGINPVAGPTLGQTDLLSQHKIIVTYNGATLTWRVGDAGPSVACNVLEKDKVNVVPDPKSGDGKQGAYENLMTKLVDVQTSSSVRYVGRVQLQAFWSLSAYWMSTMSVHFQTLT